MNPHDSIEDINFNYRSHNDSGLELQNAKSYDMKYLENLKIASISEKI